MKTLTAALDLQSAKAHLSHMERTPLYSDTPVEWRESSGLTPYPDAVAEMERLAAGIAARTETETVWLVEHPSLYSAGTSANAADLVDPDRFDVFKSGRGGQYTYHGPGQRVAYVMLDLRKRGRDVSAFVRGLEQWIMDTLAEFDVTAERRCGRVGVWVEHSDGQGNIKEEKIAAIGIRLKKWVSFHGISINVDPDLSHFGGIVPCGISEHGVTSLRALGKTADMTALDIALKNNLTRIFAPINTQ